MSKTNKSAKTFYIAQLIGWLLFAVFNLFARQYFVHFNTAELVNSLVLAANLFVITSLLRVYYKKVFNLAKLLKCFGHLIIGSILGCIASLLMYAAIVYPNLSLLFDVEINNFFQQLLMSSPVIFMLILMWSIIYLVFKKQFALNRAQAKQKALKTSLNEAKLDILLSQLNPHFLFNAINNIRALTLEDSHKARDMLTTLSEVMRYTMQIDKAPLISLEEEIEVVKHYVALNQLQFDNKLDVQYHIDAETTGFSLPPMILQLLVENAIKHGIGRIKEGGQVVISTSITDDGWQLVVDNSGQLKPADGKGIGLKNIRQRLAHVYGSAATFSIENSQVGVTATVNLPIGNNND
ncbi:sensor histidine kinase [Thalassotalea agarivorans]|uniref:Histidine kinase n=1 Tax=Thalassotalea agarivorans TaxID=349064 RepID=A0A1H9ZUI4_THASX|nr:histidine kinase [Thalassotalea agarivorans]SES85418.1 Histidine kinase [Thalassotalea agarivorans]